MKVKLLVLISLIVFSLGFVGVVVAGFVLPEGASLGGNKMVAINTTPGVSSGAVDENGTPIINPDPSPAGSTSTAPGSSAQPTTSSSTGVSSAPQTSSSTSTSPKPTTTTTTTVKPPATSQPPTTSCGSPGGVCTAAQVATHNSASNCWVIYNGGYYIVSSYVNQHPGGTAVFNSTTCGRDITSYLNGTASTAGVKRRHSNSAYKILDSYYVGKVQG